MFHMKRTQSGPNLRSSVLANPPHNSVKGRTLLLIVTVRVLFTLESIVNTHVFPGR
jgi:hypothetical protein